MISRKVIFLIVGVAVVIPVILAAGIIAIVFGGLYFGSKNTEEFVCAMSEIRKNEKAREVLGEPINDGYFIIPNIEIKNGRRTVNVSVSVSGSKSDGTMTINSFRDNFRSDFLVNLEATGKTFEIYRGKYPCGAGSG